MNENARALKHARPLNTGAEEAGASSHTEPAEQSSVAADEKVRVPLAACDCDEHCNVDICVADDVDAEACGLYGG
jgi:hypothetical protein